MNSMKDASFNWAKYAFFREVLCGSHLTGPDRSERAEDDWRRRELVQRVGGTVRPIRECAEEAG